MMFRFAFPWAFLLLPVVLMAGWTLRRRRFRGDARLHLPRSSRRASLTGGVWSKVDRAMPWVRVLAFLLMVAALARPQAGDREETVSTHGVDIVVALDVSGSMRAEDFQPLNRLEVARRTVAEFVRGRPADRIGLVVFAGVTTTRCPLTLDREMFSQFLEQVDFAPQEEDGTALGIGLATAVNRLRASDARSKVVVLVTDGRNNRGQIGPEAAAEAARAIGVRVYTAGVGTEGEAPIPVDTPRGRRYVMQRLDLDEPLLREVASRTGGEYFRAVDADGLVAAFDTIDRMEKTEIESKVRILYTELFPYLLVPAAAIFLLEGALAATRLRRVP
jgi:Ca-activated chloride channel family protein